MCQIMISNQIVSQIPKQNTWQTLKDMLQINGSFRKLLSASLATLGFAALTSITYKYFQSKRKTNEQLNQLNDIDFEPNLSKSKRPREEIEEVN